MKSENTISELTAGLVRIHKVLTRAIDVIDKRSNHYAGNGFGSNSEKVGFITYSNSFVTLFLSHHNGEEKIAFPYMKEKGSTADFDILCAQHLQMHAEVEKLKTSLQGIESGFETESLKEISAVIGKIKYLWENHICDEEKTFSTQGILSLMSEKEDADLSKQLAEHGRDNGGPGPLLIPFILYNLEGEDRKIMASHFPSVVVGLLVPYIWKKKWAPMKPLLIT